MARNPSVLPADTSAAAWRFQMAAIGRRTVDERLAEWSQLNQVGAKMEADALRRRYPSYSEREVFLSLVRLRYGDQLALEVWPEVALLIEKQAAS